MNITKLTTQNNFNGWDKSPKTRRTLAAEIYKLPNTDRAKAIQIIKELDASSPDLVLCATKKPFSNFVELSSSRYDLGNFVVSHGVHIRDNFLDGLKRFSQLVKFNQEASFATDDFIKALQDSDLAAR